MPESRKKTAGELAFLDQRTRQMMVEWCDRALQLDTNVIGIHEFKCYVAFAITKKWLADKGNEQHRILGGGWMTAARFLKR